MRAGTLLLVLLPLLLLVMSARLALADLQGLYIMTAEQGQLQLVDLGNGSRTDVGPALASHGLTVSNISVATIQQTGKWFYSFARNTTASNRRLSLVTQFLGDGSLMVARPTPDVFPETLEESSFLITVDGGWVVYVSAVVPASSGDASGGSEDRLVIVRFDRTDYPFPPSTNSTHVVVDVPLSTIGLGGAGSIFASGTMLPSGNLWFQLAKGTVCYNVNTGKQVATVPLDPSGARQNPDFRGLAYSPSTELVHGVYSYTTSSNGSNGSGAATRSSYLASFNPLTAAPKLNISSAALPQVARDGSAAVLLSDKSAFAAMTTTGSMVKANLQTGEQTGVVQLCPGPEQVCFSSWAYEPFVF
jgi:hypothetical protein